MKRKSQVATALSVGVLGLIQSATTVEAEQHPREGVDGSESNDPRLWRTRLVDPDGVPLAGVDVSVYALHSRADTDVDLARNDAVVLTQGTSDAEGYVDLRLDPSAALPFIDDSGTLVLTYSIGENQLSGPMFWTDSIFFDQTSSGLRRSSPQWETSSLLQHGGEGSELTRASTSTRAQRAAVRLQRREQLPPVMKLEAEQGDFRMSNERVDLPTGCQVKSLVSTPALPASHPEGPRGYVDVGSMYLNELWSSDFEYANSQLTEVGVGYAYGVWLEWVSASMNGYVTVSSKANEVVIQDGRAAIAGETVERRYRVPFDFRTEIWRCQTWPGQPYVRGVTYPTKLRNDLGPRMRGRAIPECSTQDRQVNPGTGFRRANSSSETSTSSYSVGFSPDLLEPLTGGAVSGGVTVSVSPTTIKTNTLLTNQVWINGASSTRFLCGVESQNLGGRTSIVALK